MDTVHYKGGASAPAPGQPYGAQPPPGWQQPPPQVAVVQMAPLSLGMEPANVRCPNCHQQVVTEVKRTTTNKTHIWMFALCIFGCWPCCLIPYCCDACRGAMHSCPSCKVDLGVGTS